MKDDMTTNEQAGGESAFPERVRNAAAANDLNAIHEAEKVLLEQCVHGFDDDWWIEYLNNLCISAPAGGMHHASAANRADALLKTWSAMLAEKEGR